MPPLKIFVSFEFDKDSELKENFYRQAKDLTSHRIKDCSLKEAYPTEEWKGQARAAIRGCDVVIVLIGPDTHNAPGVRTEVSMAQSFRKPVFQVRPQGRPYNGLTDLGDPVPWRWTRINERLNEIAN